MQRRKTHAVLVDAPHLDQLDGASTTSSTSSIPISSSTTTTFPPPGTFYGFNVHHPPLDTIPPPPPCNTCGAKTNWAESQVQPDLTWRHLFVCFASGVGENHGDVYLATPPAPAGQPVRI